MNRMEQLKIRGTESVSPESMSPAGSSEPLLAFCCDPVSYPRYSHLNWGVTDPDLFVWDAASGARIRIFEGHVGFSRPFELLLGAHGKGLKIIESAWSGKTLSALQNWLRALESSAHPADSSVESEELSPEESRTFRARDVFPTPISVENERLKSQLIATSRARQAARKTAERLAVENARLRESNQTLQRTLEIQETARICLREAHAGAVSEVLGDQVEVTYETAEGPLKQIYSREQFMQGKLPKEGDKVEAHVMIAVTSREKDQTKETEFVSALPSFRDKAVSGPIHL